MNLIIPSAPAFQEYLVETVGGPTIVIEIPYIVELIIAAEFWSVMATEFQMKSKVCHSVYI